MIRLSRRTLARLALRLAALCAAGAASNGVRAGDRGVGGTGAVPNDPEETLGQDRGIGGTGVVGTIRRFGSVVVNDLRVAYPADVRVTIDGAAATPGDLRLGQVVHILARLRGRTLETRAISVRNEVVGPVESIDEGGLTVLGQRIVADARLPAGLRRGQTVAVAGLRRPDGTVVASLVAHRPPGTPSRLAGPVVAGPDGTATIGGVVVVGLRQSLVGRRVVLAGRRIGTAFHVSGVAIEPAVPFARADRLSIEGYVARSGDELRFGSGVTLHGGRTAAALDDGDVVRAVITATPDGAGRFTAAAVHAEGRRNDGMRGERPQPDRAPDEVARPGAPDHPRGPGTAPGTGGPPSGGMGGPGGPPGGGPGGGGLGGGQGGGGRGGPAR